MFDSQLQKLFLVQSEYHRLGNLGYGLQLLGLFRHSDLGLVNTRLLHVLLLIDYQHSRLGFL